MSTPAARARMGPDATPLEDENDSDHYFRATQRLTATVARLTERVAALAGSSKMLRGPKCQSQPRVTPSHRTRWRSSRGIEKRSKLTEDRFMNIVESFHVNRRSFHERGVSNRQRRIQDALGEGSR